MWNMGVDWLYLFNKENKSISFRYFNNCIQEIQQWQYSFNIIQLLHFIECDMMCYGALKSNIDQGQRPQSILLFSAPYHIILHNMKRCNCLIALNTIKWFFILIFAIWRLITHKEKFLWFYNTVSNNKCSNVFINI